MSTSNVIEFRRKNAPPSISVAAPDAIAMANVDRKRALEEKIKLYLALASDHSQKAINAYQAAKSLRLLLEREFNNK